MSPRFRRKDESVEAGFRRIALAEIDAAIAIVEGKDRTDAEKIHQVRRQMKALRALLRLVRPAFSRFERENGAMRDLARSLSHMRDAQVMLDTFDAITGAARGHELPRSFLIVRERLGAAVETPGDVAALLQSARAALATLRGRAVKWRLSEEGWDAVSSGLEATYAQARQAMREAVIGHDAEASHEWRKGVKYHGAQMRLLRRMHPHPLRKRERAAMRLGDILGQRHDIDMLLDAMAKAPARFGDVITVTQISGLARLHIARLDRRARRIGEALFEAKARKLVRQWGRWWDEWRS